MSQTTNTRNIGFGVLVNLAIAMMVFIVSSLLYQSFIHNIFATIAAFVTALFSIVFFGIGGLRTIEVGFMGAPLFFGKRSNQVILSEGLVWYWPKPIGDISVVETKKMTFNQEVTEVLSLDDIVISLDLSSEVEVANPQLYLNVKNPVDLYKEAADGVLRLIVSKLNAEMVPRSNVGIIDVLLNGTTKSNGIPGITTNSKISEAERKELEEFEAEGIKNHALEQWGIKLNKVRITAVRLPPDLEDARANVRIEAAQQASENKEADTVLELMTKFRASFPNLTDSEIANIVQTERGKVNRLIVDGNANPIVAAGALAGGSFKQTQNGSRDKKRYKRDHRKNYSGDSNEG